MMHRLDTIYRGARLSLELENDQARLLINDIVRDTGTVTTSLRLSTTVQTDYEWHEFIEALVTRRSTDLSVVLVANKAEVARREFHNDQLSEGGK